MIAWVEPRPPTRRRIRFLRRTPARLLLPGMLALTGSGCAGSAPLDRRTSDIAQRLDVVELQGAMRCAPRELAMARSHLEFAKLEREQGSLSRARHHLDVAEENVQAAGVLSPPERCASSAESAGSPQTASPAPPTTEVP
jgi:OmpA-OmpF porin, OOP family